MRSSIAIALLSLLPILVFLALATPPTGAVAVVFWPGMSGDRQLALLVTTDTVIRSSGRAGLWVVEASTPAEIAQLKTLPAVLLPAFGSSCTAPSDTAGPAS